MDFSLTKEQEQLQKSVREFCLSEILPVADKIEKNNRIPASLISKIRKENLFGVPFNKQYGGTGSGYCGSTLVLEELARASGAVSMLVGINYLTAVPLDLFGSEDQKKKYLPVLCGGKSIGSFAFTEPATGSDPSALISEAKVESGEYVLNGIKRFITAADIDGIIVLSVQEGKATSAFIGKKNEAGYSVIKSWDKMGMRGISLADIKLDNYRIPQNNLLGKSGDGYRILLDTIAIGKLNTCAIVLGCAQAAMDEALKYAVSRMSRGRSITQFQSVQALLADIAVKVEAARCLTYHLAAMADKKENIRAESALTKIFVTETAIEIARLAFKVHGAYAYVKENKIERLLRDIYLGEIIEGSNEVQKVIVANNLMKK